MELLDGVIGAAATLQPQGPGCTVCMESQFIFFPYHHGFLPIPNLPVDGLFTLKLPLGVTELTFYPGCIPT